MDLYSKKVIAFKISQKHSANLITATFRSAYTDRQPGEGFIFHSDRGSQYTSHAMQKLLKSCDVEQSFSPAGKPKHNGVMESFFSSFKQEGLYRTDFRSKHELYEGVASYMEFYNNKRPHAAIGYKTPNTFEKRYFERSDAN